MISRSSIAGLVSLAAIVALIALAPDRAVTVFDNLLALSNVALFFFAVAVLAWFLYAVIFRRILRARRIANARMRRMVREAGERSRDQTLTKKDTKEQQF